MQSKFARALALFIVVLSVIASGCERVDPATMIARAEQALLSKEYRAASLDLKSVLQQDEANPRARWLLAEVYLAIEDGASAEKELKHAWTLGVGEDAVVPALAQALWLQDKADEVLALPIGAGLSPYARAEMQAFRALAQLTKGRLQAMADELDQVSQEGQRLPFVQFARARLFLAQLNPDAALVEAETLTNNNPDFAVGWTLLGNLFSAKKQYVEAESAHTRAIELRHKPLMDRLQRGFARVALEHLEGAEVDAEFLQSAAPKFALGHYLAGLVHFRQQQLAQAQESLERALDLNPRHFQTTFLLAVVDDQLGNSNRSRQLAEQAVAMQSGSIQARKLAALWRLRDRKGIDAEAMMRPVVRARPDDLEAKDLLASSLMLQGKADEAAVLLQQIAEQKPDSSLAKLKAGLGLLSAGNAEAGIASLNEARAVAPEDPYINATLVSGHLRQKDTYAATLAARSFLEKKPDDPAAHNLLAAAQSAAGEKGLAIASYERSLELDPADIKAVQMLATIAAADGNYDKALVYAKAGLVQHPDDLQLLMMQAVAARAMSNEKLYHMSLQVAIEAHPDEAGPRAMMARKLLEESEPEKALTVLSGVSGLNHPAVLFARAEANHRLNRLSDAKRDLEALARRQPDSVELQIQLARIYEALEDWIGLEKALTRILELAPDDEWAVLAKARLAISSDNSVAARSLLQSRGLQPGDDIARLTVWMALVRSEKNFAGEVEYAKHLLKIEPTTRHMVLLNRARRRMGDLDGMERGLVDWLRSYPDDVPVLFELSSLYIEKGDVDKSLEQLRRIEAVDEENLYALNNLAWYLRERSPVEAKRFAERALDLAPDEPTVVDTYAAVFMGNREFPKALRALDRAIDRGKQTAGLRLRRAEVLLAMGDRGRAMRELEVLLESAPPLAVKARAEKQLAELSQ